MICVRDAVMMVQCDTNQNDSSSLSKGRCPGTATFPALYTTWMGPEWPGTREGSTR